MEDLTLYLFELVRNHNLMNERSVRKWIILSF